MTRGVLFDLDGTLVDTVYLHAVCWWQALRQHGLDIDTARVHRAIGMGSDRILDHLAPDRVDRDHDDAIRAAHGSLYAQYWDRIRPTAGARDLVRAVDARGLRVVFASSAGPPELAAVRRALDVDQQVDTATGAADAPTSKPAPDIVAVALQRCGMDPAEAVFVGDSVWDAQACQALSVPCIGLLTGGWCAGELRDAGAVETYDDPRALLRALDRSILLNH
jgi:HAD superfamily hydrolase (TIGR01509 family)